MRLSLFLVLLVVASDINLPVGHVDAWSLTPSFSCQSLHLSKGIRLNKQSQCRNTPIGHHLSRKEVAESWLPPSGTCLLLVQPRGIHQQPTSQRDAARCSQPTSTVTTTTLHSFNEDWEGDDIRWTTRWRRRLQSSFRLGTAGGRVPICRNSILALNIFFFVHQTITTIASVRRRHPDYWPSHAIAMITDAILGATRPGPTTLDLAHISRPISSLSVISLLRQLPQPHRLITSGFLHGGLIHLLVNMDSLRRLPVWLETGLGVPLYLTTYLTAIVAGNISHTLMTPSQSFCVGASGGICGLYGLLYVSLLRMGNSAAASRVIRGMGILVLYGLFLANVSNAGHVGGFLAGIAMGTLFGPRYRKDYAARRKWAVGVDESSRDYRAAMGFGIKPSPQSIFPLALFWSVSILGLIALNPNSLQAIVLVGRTILHPGAAFAAL